MFNDSTYLHIPIRCFKITLTIFKKLFLSICQLFSYLLSLTVAVSSWVVVGKPTLPCFFLLEPYYTILRLRISMQLCVSVHWLSGCGICSQDQTDSPSPLQPLQLPLQAAFPRAPQLGSLQRDNPSSWCLRTLWSSCLGEWSTGEAQDITTQDTEKESQILFFLSVLGDFDLGCSQEGWGQQCKWEMVALSHAHTYPTPSQWLTQTQPKALSPAPFTS